MTRDSLLQTKVLSATSNPQQLVWLAMHQDYSSEPAYKSHYSGKQTEDWYGQKIVEHLLAGNRGHFGCFEHPQITVNACYYPHDVISQARTHRVGISFDVQSFRYTGENLLKVQTLEDLERVFYFRPVGEYVDRSGKKYEYTEAMRLVDKELAMSALLEYNRKVGFYKFSEEHARQMLPYSCRQHFVVSFNARSLMHFLDLRSKADAQLEIQWLANDLFAIFREWMPQVCDWYERNRLHKARLAP